VELRIRFNGVEQNRMRCLPKGGLCGVSKGGDDQLQMFTVQKILNFFALDVGYDLIEEHDGLVVYFLLILSVNGLKFIHYSSKMIHELLLIGSCECI
jgi:hypothetical protein